MPTNLSGTVVLIVISPGESGLILSPGTPNPNGDLGFIKFCIIEGLLDPPPGEEPPYEDTEPPG